MLTEEQAKRLTAKILSYSTFPECSVSLSWDEQCYTRFANNGITTAGLSEQSSIIIQSTREQRSGVAETADASEEALRAAVKRSEEIAAISPPNPEHQPPLGPQKYPASPAFDEATARARAAHMVPKIKTIIDAAIAKKVVAAGFFERSYSTSAIANKQGLFGFHQAADSRLSTTIRAGDGSSAGWAGQPSIHINEIDAAALASTAIGKCLAWKNPQRLEPSKYTVVLEPTAVGDLVKFLLTGFQGLPFSARATEEGRTFLSKKGGGTRAGQKLFPEWITLRSAPFDARQPAAPWSPEWLPNRPVTWIEKGVVKNLYYDRYWAAKTGQPPTPAPSTIILEGTETPLAELIKGVERGLLVTHFWYIRFVNPQTQQYTGLTRDGVFLIEEGKVTQPVMNFRFNESPVQLLQNAEKLGQAVRVKGLEGVSLIAPPIVARDFAFTSISDAV